MSNTTVERDLGWSKIKDEIEAAKKYRVKIGWQEGDKAEDGETIAYYMSVHELGLGGVVQRAPIRKATDTNKAKWQAVIDKQWDLILQGKATIQSGLSIVGQVAQKDIQATITTGPWEPNKASTIRAKAGKRSGAALKKALESNKPLIWTGAARQGVRYVVYE